MTALIVIPARLESSRLPGKMLMPILGRTLIERTWRTAYATGLSVVIATDSVKIRDEARAFGALVILTGPAANGTERCALAVRGLENRPDMVVNWQGDSPLCPPFVAHELIAALQDPSIDVATPVRTVARPAMLERGEVSVAVSPEGRALYFSRSAIPREGPWLAHVGMYAYRLRALQAYGTDPTPLEEIERLEQLRFVERGTSVGCVRLEGVGRIPEVNEPGDVATVERILGESR